MSGSESAEADAEYYRELLRPIFGGRRFILIGSPVASYRGLSRQLRQLGAERPFLLGTFLGTGPIPGAEGPEWRSAEIRGRDAIDTFRRFEAWLEALPPEVENALDRFDPERQARALGLIVLGPIERVAGRALFARRNPRWAALEDKTRVDELWDAIGVRRAPSRIVPPESEALRAAARDLDRGLGTVWSGDASEGPNGGATHVRWVCGADEAREAQKFFEEHCRRLRVMPFLDGIPCSIHGIGFADGVSVFRPVEGITLRRPQRHELVYSGMATFWDPPQADREALRALARRTGERLRELVDYRGPFTIDGVQSSEGFLPTELNPRFGAGLGPVSAGVPELPLALVALAAMAGEALAFDPERLERAVLEGSDRQRAGAGWIDVPTSFDETCEHALVAEGDRYRRARDGEEHDGLFVIGPGGRGGFVRFAPDAQRTPAGPSLAPRVCRAFAWADRELGTGIGPVEPAPER